MQPSIKYLTEKTVLDSKRKMLNKYLLSLIKIAFLPPKRFSKQHNLVFLLPSPSSSIYSQLRACLPLNLSEVQFSQLLSENNSTDLLSTEGEPEKNDLPV